MNLSSLPFSLLLLAQLPLALFAAPKSPSLTPPAGNSIQIKTKALDGLSVYRCTGGAWLPLSASATLVDISNPSSMVGNFSFVYTPRQPRYAGTWTLLNSPGDAAESGSVQSLVSGKIISSFSDYAPEDLDEFLAEASHHKSYGAAFLVSYISRINTNGGLPPADRYCDDDAVTSVSFQADFYFWKQDVTPPSVPQQLQPNPDHRPVESFFCKGVVKYVFSGTEWTQKNVVAKMYDLPGGTQLGSFYLKSKADDEGGRYCWNVSNPHGFEIVAKTACNPVPVGSTSLPWSLMIVTSSNGNTTLLGPFSYVQMVSTTGGLPPTISDALKRKVWRSPFTAIFWLYCSR